MASFLEDITPFYGTGERNGKGQTLEEFLEEYDPYRYKNPCCTTDTVVFSYKDEQALKEGRLKILLVKRGNHPSIGCWALPGGFVNLRENLEDTARRELQEETGVSGLPVEQFACYGDYQRDPRARIITSAYLSIVKESDVSVEAGDDAADAAWFEIEMEPETVYEEDGWEKTEYHLTIQNQDQKMNAVVQKKELTGLVKEKYYVVKEGGEQRSYTPRPRTGGYNQGGDRPYRPRTGGYQGGGYNRPYRPRTADYNPNAKYSLKKQIEYKDILTDPNEPIRLN